MNEVNSKIVEINRIYNEEYLPGIKFYNEEDTDLVCKEILYQITQYKNKEGEFSYNNIFRSEKIGNFDFKEKLKSFFALFDNLSNDLSRTDFISQQLLKDITESMGLLNIEIPKYYQYNFIPLKLLLQWYNKIIKSFIIIRETRLWSFDLLPLKPSDNDILEFSELIDDDLLKKFLQLFKELVDKIKDYALRLQILYIYYIRRVNSIYDYIIKHQDTISYFNESSDIIERETKYYITYLKEKDMIAKNWKYSFQSLGLLKDIFLKEYPSDDYYKVNSFFKVNKYGLDDNEEEKDKLPQDVKDKKEMRIFLSSTFSDMQEERDFLIQVFNMLKEEAKERGIKFSVVDLRWGITPEEAARGSVIDLCLSEIQRSKPFFIGIIGENYGSVPPVDLITNKELINKYPWIAQDIKNGLSYTEIEIQSGVLRNPEKINAYFYIKESDNKVENPKLNKLKQALQNQNRYPVKFYKYPEDVANDIIEDFRDLIVEMNPEEPYWTPLAQFKWKENLYYKSLLEFNIPILEMIENINSFLQDSSKSFLLIQGHPGSGKSTWAANIINFYKEQLKTLYFFPAVMDSQSGTFLNMLNLWMGNEFFAVREITYYNAYEKVLQKLQSIEEKLLIVIDDADKIDFSSFENEIPSWISAIPENVKVVFTVGNSYDLDKLLSEKIRVKLEIGEMNINARREFINKYLLRVGKKLTEQQMTNLLKSSLLYTPRILKSFADELASFGYFEQLDTKILKLASLKNLEDFYSETFNRLEIEYGYEKVKKISQYLSLSRGEVRLRDLYEGMQIENFLILIANGASVFKLNDDTVGFTDDVAKQIAYQRYFEDKENENFIRNRMLKYLSQKSKKEEIHFMFYDIYGDYIYYCPDAICIYDLAYLVAQSSNIDDLTDFIENPNYFGILYVTDKKLLDKIWKLLIDNNYDFSSLIEKMQLYKYDKKIWHLILNEIEYFADIHCQSTLSFNAMYAELEDLKSYGNIYCERLEYLETRLKNKKRED